MIGNLPIIGEPLTNSTKIPNTINKVVLLKHGGQTQYKNAAKAIDQMARNNLEDKNFFIL